jgi:hypothetical protein
MISIICASSHSILFNSIAYVVACVVIYVISDCYPNLKSAGYTVSGQIGLPY